MELHMSSLRVRKRHCGRCIRIHRTVSATGSVCWTSILHLGYSILALRAVWCTSLGGPHPVGDVRCFYGCMTSPASSERQFVRLYLSHPRFHYPDSHAMCDSSPAVPGRRTLRCSRCISATWDDRRCLYAGLAGRRGVAGGIAAPTGRAFE